MTIPLVLCLLMAGILPSSAAVAGSVPGPALGRGKLAEPPSIIKQLKETHRYYLASASIAALPDGRILAVGEKQPKSRGSFNPEKFVRVSDDGGASWQSAGTFGPMQWPSVFSTSSGVYALGVERYYSPDNNLVISKMLDTNGANWTEPVRLTRGLSIVTANGGIDVSGGRVAKVIEVVPANYKTEDKPRMSITKPIAVNFNIGMPFGDWIQQKTGPKLPEAAAAVTLESGSGIANIPIGEVLKLEHAPSSRKAYFRLISIKGSPEHPVLQLRPEAFNLAFTPQTTIEFPEGSLLTLAAGDDFVGRYGATAWEVMVLSAPEHEDLLDPRVWDQSNPVANPANSYRAAMHELLGINSPAFDMEFVLTPEEQEAVQKAVGSIAAKDANPYLGFGSTFFMEGTPVRLLDSRGGDGSLQVLMRVNNGINCNIGALVSVSDSSSDVTGHKQQPKAKFLRYTFAPGISVAHPATIYDESSDVYWYVGNVPRDSLRNWSPLKVKAEAHTWCEVDRSTIGLYYSANALDWVFAGLVDFGNEFREHFTYPQMITVGDDLLIATRATLKNAPEFYNNHYSNALVMHRIKDFRRLANLDWVRQTYPMQNTRRALRRQFSEVPAVRKPRGLLPGRRSGH